jgi:chromosome segregation ATPase
LPVGLKALGRQDRAELAEASRRLSDVGQKLADALEHAEAVKTERDELQRQLNFASQYTLQIEGELTEQREVVRRLLRKSRCCAARFRS